LTQYDENPTHMRLSASLRFWHQQDIYWSAHYCKFHHTPYLKYLQKKYSSCFSYVAILSTITNTDMRRLTMGIRSETRVVRRFRLCTNVYLHKPR